MLQTEDSLTYKTEVMAFTSTADWGLARNKREVGGELDREPEQAGDGPDTGKEQDQDPRQGLRGGGTDQGHHQPDQDLQPNLDQGGGQS